MTEIHVHEFVSLDGVFENPAFTAPYGFTPAMGELLGGITGGSSDILLGRKTWEMFWPAWSTRSAEDDPGAPFFNDSPKHVVTSTLDAVDEWSNSRVVGPYDADAIRALKEQAEGNIYVSGSGTLVRALLADGLVDALHLLVYPIVLGQGERLFPDGMANTQLALNGSEAFDNGVVHLDYGPA